jgi:catechol 2,3-dioxygenase-like lactoylglutathione lyase family enzyme
LTNRLDEQIDFFTQVLGFELIKKDGAKAYVKIGQSTLVWQQAITTPYHVVFNIPSNQENEALDWLRNRVDIIQAEARHIIDFKSGNVKAVYFMIWIEILWNLLRVKT